MAKGASGSNGALGFQLGLLRRLLFLGGDLGFGAQPMLDFLALGAAFALPDRVGALADLVLVPVGHRVLLLQKSSILARRRRPGEQIADLGVAQLVKVPVIVADRAEVGGGLQRNRLVDLA